MNRYKKYRTCKKCGTTEEVYLVSEEAAFDTGMCSEPCKKCNSVKYISEGIEKPVIDDHLLEIWSINDSLHFIDQDEEIYLADKKIMNLLFKYLDEESTIPYKKDILTGAICILLYDCVESENNKQLIKKLTSGLQSRINMLNLHDNIYIMPHIKEVVWTLLK